MARVYVSSVIDASAPKIWERLRDFSSLSRWHPRIRDCRIEGDQPGDKIGVIRLINLQNGDAIREQLLGLSDYDTFVTYSILESPMPIENYLATLRLTPISDGDRCFIEWSAEFDCAPDAERELITAIGHDVFQSGFDALKRQFGG